MSEIDWSKAPKWADRVVLMKGTECLCWANDDQCEMIAGQKYGYVCSSFDPIHVKNNWEVVERRPIPDPEIDWSKAPKWADRVIEGGASNLLYWASDNMLQPVIEGGASFVTHTHIRNGLPVVERRPVPQTINIRPPETFMCRCVAAPVARTIEQRIASLRALEKKVEETRAELTRDLEALGLTWMVRDEPEQPIITDWRDLRVGDVIWVGESSCESDAPCGEYCIVELDFEDTNQPVGVNWRGRKSWPELEIRGWRFIRRP